MLIRYVLYLARLIGTRDLAQLRTLLSIVFKWYIEPESNGICDAITTGNIENVSLNELLSGTSRLWMFVFRSQLSGHASSSSPSTSTQAAARTHITQTIISRHLADLWRPSLLLSSVPISQASAVAQDVAYVRACLDDLLPL